MLILYDYQEEIVKTGLTILNKYKMLYLALQPRSGKTPISLTVLKRQDPDQKILFVTTKSAIPGIHKIISEMELTMAITVINYESLHRVQGLYNTIVIDEAHKNISRYPRPSKSWEALNVMAGPTTQIVWLSGTTNIESSSQLYHQLALSYHHSFSRYKNFFHWFNAPEHYKRPGNYGGYGIPGKKHIGYNKESNDYSHTKNFDSKIDPIMIRYSTDDLKPEIIIKYTQMSLYQSELYSEMKLSGTTKMPPSMAANAAGKLSKLQQIASGTLIGEVNSYVISTIKAELIAKEHPNVPVFYKYKMEYVLLSRYIDSDLLYQIDSQNTGLDLSMYDEMVIFSLTFSGANFTQVISRLSNVNRITRPKIFIYLSEGTVDDKTFANVVTKKDNNERFLRK